MKENGLFVVATPIGNLEDITFRAVRVLGEVDVIAAEDTRHTARLLQHYDIRTPVLSMHEHNETRVLKDLVARLESGESIALVSDAGTPLISDPGFQLLKTVRARGIRVHAIPGPSAVTSALSVAGLPTDRWVFEGFLPAKSTARKKRLDHLAAEPRTIVLFESSHRISASLRDLAASFGPDRNAVVCRELTKQFETVNVGTLEALSTLTQSDSNQRKGEFVILVQGAETGRHDDDIEHALHLAQALLEYLPASKASKVAARLTGVHRRAVYELLENN